MVQVITKFKFYCAKNLKSANIRLNNFNEGKLICNRDRHFVLAL